MKTENIQVDCSKSSEVSKFYEGKSVFISGAGGFLGKVLLEILLRCCPGIIKIYILLRPKNGLRATDRKKEIFKREIFTKLREKDPGVFNKVIVVPGDVSQHNLGMSENDMNKIIQEVSVLFHCAASISFFKPISFVMNQNVIATDNVINLCKNMSKLEAFVYTSTLFSNSNRKKDIKEIIYKLPFEAEEVLLLARNGDEQGLLSLYLKCNPNFPNYYTFSKCVSENLIAEKASSLPVSIVRPSSIINCMKGSLPGYLEEGAAFVNLGIGLGKGIIRVLRVYGASKFEFIPVDIAANTHIIAAFLQATKSIPSPIVYNCTSGKMSEHTWSEFAQTLLEATRKYPLPNSYIIPSITICNNPLSYKFYFFVYHILPATIMDGFMWITGKELRLLRIYKFVNRIQEIGEIFLINPWDFTCDNFASLSEKLNDIDAKLFHVNVREFSMTGWAQSLYTGTPQYRVNGKLYKDTFSACILRYFITYFIKFFVLGSIAALCYIVIF